MRSTRRALVVGGLSAAAVAASPAPPAGPAHPPTRGSPVENAFFGLHDGTGLSRRRLAPGSVRLWDVSLTWRDLETAPGVFNFTRPTRPGGVSMDDYLDRFGIGFPGGPTATYVLGQTPGFYAPQPRDPFSHTHPPADLATYDAYVRAVATRYRGRIENYQVWNEANNRTFYRGSTADMASMTRIVARAVADCDPGARVVAPSGPVRKKYQRDWFFDGRSGYFATTVPGTTDKPWQYFDRVGFSMYPPAGEGPEAMLDMLGAMRKLMTDAGVPAAKQVPHASEINYDVEAGGASLLPEIEQVAYTMRTYLVAAMAGFERVYWYRYDWGLFPDGRHEANTYWSNPVALDPRTPQFSVPTPAGRAFTRIRSWMSGPMQVAHDSDPYQVRFADTVTVLWTSTGTVMVPASAFGRRVTRSDGSTTIYERSQSIPVDSHPVMVDSSPVS